MNFKITACIVIYDNKLEDLQKAINSFLSSSLEVKLFLIDNSPLDTLKKFFNDKRIEYCYNPSNPGFGSAHNIAIKKAIEIKSEYHLILNPDIYFDKKVISSLKNFMDKNGDIGLVMPKILYPDGRVQFLCKLLPTPLDLIFRRFVPFKFLIEKMNNRFELQFFNYNEVVNIPYLSGCFMFCRTDVLREIGGFDERFFMYLEDTDLSRRIHKLYKTVFYPKEIVYHKFEKASYREKKLLKWHIQSAVKYFSKWGWFIDKERRQFNKSTILRIIKIQNYHQGIKNRK